MFERLKFNKCVNTIHSIAEEKDMSSKTVERIASVIFSKPIFSKEKCKLIFQNEYCLSEMYMASFFIALKALTNAYKDKNTDKFEAYTDILAVITAASMRKLTKLSESDYELWYEQFKYFNDNIDELYEQGDIQDFIRNISNNFLPLIFYCMNNNKLMPVNDDFFNAEQIFDFSKSFELLAECMACLIVFNDNIQDCISEDKSFVMKRFIGGYTIFDK